MNEITCIKDKLGNDYSVFIPKWWYYNQETGNLHGSLTDEDFDHVFVTHVAMLESEIETGIIAIASNSTNYLLWREAEVHPQNIQFCFVENWELRGFNGGLFDQSWTAGLYLTLELGVGWEHNSRLPQVRLSGYLHNPQGSLRVVAKKGWKHKWQEVQQQGTYFENEPLASVFPLTNDLKLARSKKGRTFVLAGDGLGAENYLNSFDIPSIHYRKSELLATAR